MARRRPPQRRTSSKRPQGSVRVVGGTMRGREITFDPDPRTRPMKDRVREAVFNLLGKPTSSVLGIDLFAGTGAMAFEILSRGAGSAICIERHRPTAEIILESARTFAVESRLEVSMADTFYWWRICQRDAALPVDRPWWVFCCPPYDLYEDEPEQLDGLLHEMWSQAPGDSWLVVEGDKRFEPKRLPEATWDFRRYSPAWIYLAQKP